MIENKITSKKNSSTLSITEIVVTLLILGLSSWFLVLPKYYDNNTLKQTKQENLLVIDENRKDLSDLKKLTEQVSNEKQNLALLDEALPLDNRITKLQVLLEQYVKSNGLELIGFNTQVNTTTGGQSNLDLPTDDNDPRYSSNRSLTTIPLELNVKGTTEQIKNLLQTIETGGRIVDVTGIDLNPGEVSGVQAKIKLQTYGYIK